MITKKVENYPTEAYFPIPNKKTRICIHHTQGGSAASAINWWKETKSRKVGTAYVIDKDGTIYEVFDDKYYAWQFSIRTVDIPYRMELETQTIGIELANEGPLFKKQDDTFVTTYGTKYNELVVTQDFRKFMHWATYTEAQYTALRELIQHLCKKHSIIPKYSNTLKFGTNIAKENTIFTHTNCNKEKSDVSPAFDWTKIM
jgi:N-acetyl-anhydromuramyl-L-alanine amidase AmpD